VWRGRRIGHTRDGLTPGELSLARPTERAFRRCLSAGSAFRRGGLIQDYRRQFKTLDDHMRKKRNEGGLRQREVADLLGVDPQSVNAWERNYHQPSLHLLPAIIGFLNYNPDVIADQASLGRRIAVRRRALGISQQALAGLLGIDEGTLGGLE